MHNNLTKKVSIFFMSVFLIFALVGCGNTVSTTSSNKPKPKPKPKIAAQYIVDTLKTKEGNYMTDIVVTTADNDENKLLGRPHQYTEKINWKDNRAKDSHTDCTVEIFKNSEDAVTRKNYVDNIEKNMAPLVQYLDQKKNVLLRIDGRLTPQQSKEYTDIFDKLMQ